MNAVTHTTRGTLIGTAYDVKYHDRSFDATAEEIIEGLDRNDRCCQIIANHFKSCPDSIINASEMARIYGAYDFHTYRSRMTELGDTKSNQGILHQLPERVPSCYTGKTEHLYCLTEKGHKILFPGPVQLDMFSHRKAV